MPEAVVRLENLEKQFQGAQRPALANVSANIKPGIITGLVGPDGAGKTTLMRIIAGLLMPTSGRVLVAGRDRANAAGRTSLFSAGGEEAPSGSGEPTTVLQDGSPSSKPSLQKRRKGTEPSAAAGAALPETSTAETAPQDQDTWLTAGDSRLRDFIGYMPQKFGLYEDLSVQENLQLHGDLRGVLGSERESVFKRLLEFTDLARFTSRLAGKLSGGMKQKLGLACALLGHPQLLLLDEPGVGVDPISRRDLWRMVHELIAQGLTVIWSTAYLDEAELCGEVLLLNEGQLLFSGPPSGLTGRVQGRCLQIREIAGSRRQLLARALRRPEVMDGVIQGHSVRVVLRKGETLPQLQQLEAGPEAKVVPVAPRFEDGFIDVLGGGPGGDSVLAHRIHPISGNADTVVEAVELTKKFGDFTATDRVTFAVKRGEIFGLLGPNGAGKSTTFRMMCGLLAPTSGTARIMGIDLRKSASQARQRLGYMAQKFSLYGNLTVRQNLAFFSGAYGLRGGRQQQAVQSIIDTLKFEPFLTTNSDTLPLGFKQRLALGCAVMHEPAILFLDEPTSGVDPVTRREFWTHINGLVEKGVTVVVTTHFMDEAEYCDRIALVFRGRIIATGTPDQLKAQAATRETPDPSMEDAFIALVKNESRKDA